MKRILSGIALVLGLGQMAFGTAELQLTSGSTTVTIVDNGSGDANSAPGTIGAFNQIAGGWTVSLSGGTSHSPGLAPFGINVSSVSAACSDLSCDANPLTILFSDTDFTTQISNFTASFSATLEGPGVTTQDAYVDTANGLFGLGSLIGTVGPISTPTGSGAITGGGAAGPSSYSLTLREVFTDPGNASVAFTNAGGDITGVPEPAAVALFGTVLALYATRLRRKRRLSSDQ